MEWPNTRMLARTCTRMHTHTRTAVPPCGVEAAGTTVNWLRLRFDEGKERLVGLEGAAGGGDKAGVCVSVGGGGGGGAPSVLLSRESPAVVNIVNVACSPTQLVAPFVCWSLARKAFTNLRSSSRKRNNRMKPLDQW